MKNDRNLSDTDQLVFIVGLVLLMLMLAFYVNPGNSRTKLYVVICLFTMVCLYGLYRHVSNRRYDYVGLYKQNEGVFLDCAKQKYEAIAKELGKPATCINDGNFDIWITEGKIVRMRNWDAFVRKIKSKDSQYTQMIIDGEKGDIVNFEYQLIDNSKIPYYGKDGLEHHLDTGKEYIEKKPEEQKAPETKEMKVKVTYS